MRRIFRVIFLQAIPLLWAILTWILRYGRHPEKYPLAKRYQKTHCLMKSINKTLLLDIQVEGLDKINPQQAYLFVSDHQSAFDPLVYISIIENVPLTFVAKVEAKKIPFVPSVISLLNGLFMDRKDLKQSLKVMLKVEADLKAGTHSWLIFPEGTRNRESHNSLLPFHPGTFKPAVKAGVPIVPVAIYGSFRALKFKLHLRRYPIFIKFGEPILPEQYNNMTTDELAKMTHDFIEEQVAGPLKVKDEEYIANLK